MNTPPRKTPAKKTPRPTPGGTRFKRLRLDAGLADKQKAAKTCGVTERTIENWDRKGAPPMAERLLLLLNRRECAGAGEGWRGWLFSRGALLNSRLKIRLTPERLALWPATCRRLDEAERELERLKRRCPAMRLIRAAARRWPTAARLARAIDQPAANPGRP